MNAKEMQDFVSLPHIQSTASLMDETIRKGATAYLKFTCLNCHSRQTIETPNTIYTSGLCEACGCTSDFTDPKVELGLLYMSGTPTKVLDDIFNGA